MAQWVMLCRVSRAGYILVKHVMGPQGIRLGQVVMQGCIGGSRGGLCGNSGEGTVGRAPIGETSWRLRVGSGMDIVCGGSISISSRSWSGVEWQVEGKGKGVEALAGVLHGGEERLVVVLVVRAAVAVAAAVGSSHLPHYPPDSGLRKGKGGGGCEVEMGMVGTDGCGRPQSHELLLSSSSLLIYLSRPVPSRLDLG